MRRPQLELDEHLEHFRRRILQDALNEATAAYWRRRAATFEGARPRPQDHTGQASPEAIAAQDHRISQVAEACRHAASLAPCAAGRP